MVLTTDGNICFSVKERSLDKLKDVNIEQAVRVKVTGSLIPEKWHQLHVSLAGSKTFDSFTTPVTNPLITLKIDGNTVGSTGMKLPTDFVIEEFQKSCLFFGEVWPDQNSPLSSIPDAIVYSLAGPITINTTTFSFTDYSVDAHPSISPFYEILNLPKGLETMPSTTFLNSRASCFLLPTIPSNSILSSTNTPETEKLPTKLILSKSQVVSSIAFLLRRATFSAKNSKVEIGEENPEKNSKNNEISTKRELLRNQSIQAVYSTTKALISLNSDLDWLIGIILLEQPDCLSQQVFQSISSSVLAETVEFTFLIHPLLWSQGDEKCKKTYLYMIGDDSCPHALELIYSLFEYYEKFDFDQFLAAIVLIVANNPAHFETVLQLVLKIGDENCLVKFATKLADLEQFEFIGGWYFLIQVVNVCGASSPSAVKLFSRYNDSEQFFYSRIKSSNPLSPSNIFGTKDVKLQLWLNAESLKNNDTAFNLVRRVLLSKVSNNHSFENVVCGIFSWLLERNISNFNEIYIQSDNRPLNSKACLPLSITLLSVILKYLTGTDEISEDLAVGTIQALKTLYNNHSDTSYSAFKKLGMASYDF